LIELYLYTLKILYLTINEELDVNINNTRNGQNTKLSIFLKFTNTIKTMAIIKQMVIRPTTDSWIKN